MERMTRSAARLAFPVSIGFDCYHSSHADLVLPFLLVIHRRKPQHSYQKACRNRFSLDSYRCQHFTLH